LDRDFDEDVHRRAVPLRRRESPRAHRVDRPLIEDGAEPLQNPDVGDAPVAAHDDLEYDVAGNPAPPGVVGVIRLNLVQQRWRRDAGSRTERSASRTAAAAGPDSRARALSE